MSYYINNSTNDNNNKPSDQNADWMPAHTGQ